MNKRNKVELNKVKKDIFSYFDPFGFYFMLKYAKTATNIMNFITKPLSNTNVYSDN